MASITRQGAPVTITKPAATGATNTSPYGYTQAQADAIKDAVIAIINALDDAGIIVAANPA